MAEILVYFLYGKARLLAIESLHSEILRYSSEHLRRHDKVSLAEISREFGFPLSEGDYGFDLDHTPDNKPSSEHIAGQFEEYAESIHTFYTEFVSGEHTVIILLTGSLHSVRIGRSALDLR